jgi:phosphatidylserine decarboxylase
MRVAQGSLSWILGTALLATVVLIITILTPDIIQALFFFFFMILFCLLLLLLLFFRDPEKKTGEGIVTAADGVIREIASVHDAELGDCTKISIFMNLHNVHVNRMPYDGRIQNIIHTPGTYLPAFMKESWRNERVTVMIKTSYGPMKLVLIAGTVARRIVPYIHKGDIVKKGQRIGLIRLGSRVDLYLPQKKLSLQVQEKDRVLAGVSTLALIHD